MAVGGGGGHMAGTVGEDSRSGGKTVNFRRRPEDTEWLDAARDLSVTGRLWNWIGRQFGWTTRRRSERAFGPRFKAKTEREGWKVLVAAAPSARPGRMHSGITTRSKGGRRAAIALKDAPRSSR